MKRIYAVAAVAAAAAVVAGGAAVGYANRGAYAASHGKTASGPGTSASIYGANATSSNTAGSVQVPPSLRVPAGSRLVASLHVLQGVQVYTCTAGQWTFKEPDANMAEAGSQNPTVLYTAGPEWVSTTDGSAVWGSPIREVAEPGTIPDLLVKAVKTRGAGGLFGDIDYIQRLDTWGGLPPAGSCTSGSLAASPYHATEDFWAPAGQ